MSIFKKLFGGNKKTEKNNLDNNNSANSKDEMNLIQTVSKNEEVENLPNEMLKQKFFRNLELMVEYDILIDGYCDIFDTWEEKPIGSEITYFEIHPKIKNILEIEFSEDKCEKVTNEEFDSNEIENLISKLDADYLLYKPQCDYTQKKENNLLNKFEKGEF